MNQAILHVPQIIVTPDSEHQTIRINGDSASSSETADESDVIHNYEERSRNLRCRYLNPKESI